MMIEIKHDHNSYREHHPYYERRMDQQVLDTLLRIEEMLAALLNEMAGVPRITAAEQPSPEKRKARK